MEKRGGALIDVDRIKLENRMRAYYDATISWDSLVAISTGLTRDAAGFDARKVRDKVRKAEAFQINHIKRYALRPMETVWAYYSAISPLWNRSRPDLWGQCWEGNKFFLTRFQASANPEGSPFYFTGCLSDDHLLSPDAVAVPLQIRQTGGLFEKGNTQKANLSEKSRSYLASLGVTDPDNNADEASLIWYHALAIGYSPTYLTENANGIRADFPRVPLPSTIESLRASAALGEQIAILLDTETAVAGVTIPPLRDELKTIAVLTHNERVGLQEGDLSITAGWGNQTKTGVMPGRGKIEAHSDGTLDVYLNANVAWRGVPPDVWRYTIGGYQVLKKWLSYREQSVLGRPLTVEEAREFRNIARRITTILVLASKLDANYRTAMTPVPLI